MTEEQKKSQYNESRKQSMMKYAKKNLKRIPLDVQLSEYDRIKAAADAAGEPVNTYIKNAINARLESGK